MSEAIIVALITGGISLIGIVVSYIASTANVRNELKIKHEVLRNDINRMQEDIKTHNNYARLFSESMPVVQEQIKVINHRIEDLERGRKDA